MRRIPITRDFFSFAFSVALHVGLAAALITIPAEVRKRYEVVDMTVHQTKKPLPEPEELEELPEEEVEVPPQEEKPSEKKKIKKAVKEEPPPAPPPDEAPPPEAVEEAPPVFDLGDNTFTTGNGQGAAWQLQRSEGNTKFAGVAKKKQPSVRHTKVKAEPKGKPGGTGKKLVTTAPVPLKDLSKRPEPKGGPPPAPPYPLEARKAGVEGPVVLQVFIDKNGKVKRTRVIKSPSDILAKAAKTAIAKIMWTPPLDKEGKPVDTVIVWTYRYVLDG